MAEEQRVNAKQQRLVSPSIHQLKVTLQEISPPIWRRLVVPSEITLGKLHEILQASMGWHDSHLYLFKVQERLYGEPGPEWDLRVRNAGRASLNKIAPLAGNTLIYEYDLGDRWLHEILVEEVTRPEPRKRYPLCVDGERACPPEDCGGVPGYEELRRVVANPRHRDHKNMMTWLGGQFDPDAFDPQAVNDELRWIRVGRSFPRL